MESWYLILSRLSGWLSEPVTSSPDGEPDRRGGLHPGRHQWHPDLLDAV